MQTGVQGIAGSKLARKIRVIDQTHILHERILSSFEQDESAGIEYFRFANGNQTIIYKAKQGMRAYDVKTDQESDWK